MASSSTSYTNKSKLDHKIKTKVSDNLYPVTFERTVSAGQSTYGQFRISSYYTEPAKGHELPVQRIGRFEEYVAGCTQHENCLGHFCITPRGSVLLPQRLTSTLGVMSNDYAKMAESLYARDTHNSEIAYREKLRKLMLGKGGKMRGDMPSGPVDCSARQIISLCWEIPPNHMAVPKRAAENMRVLRIEKDEETGLSLGQYTEDRLRENDWIIAVRPPSLWAGSVQPMRVVLWDHECFGLSPSNADEFHADHDGDEMQIYFIGKEASINQCSKWIQLSRDKFQEAVEQNELPKNFKTTTMQQREEFMVCSTLSIKELLSGEKLPSISKAARVKEPMANMFAYSLKNPDETFRNFSRESIRGIKDVMAQQLRQGILGDISRQARLASSCIQYKGQGIFYIKSSTETLRVVNVNIKHIVRDNLYPLHGNPCMRAMTALCSVAQQAALDSHRVSQSVSSSLDLIDNLIRGGSESLIATVPECNMLSRWKYVAKDVTYYIVDNASIKSNVAHIIATYNPSILDKIQQIGKDIRKVCKLGILMVCNYYTITLSELELSSIVELLCFKVGSSQKPITTKQGLLSRDLRWMSVIFANHYGELLSLQNKGKTRRPVNPETITDAAALCNFDYM